MLGFPAFGQVPNQPRVGEVAVEVNIRSFFVNPIGNSDLRRGWRDQD